MGKFCRNCGTEIGEAKFCPNCGTSSEKKTVSEVEVDINEIIGKIKQVFKNIKITNKIKNIFLLIFPIIYALILFGTWFRISVPIYGDFELHLYDLYSGIKDIMNEIPVYMTIFILSFPIIALFIIYLCIRMVMYAVKEERYNMLSCLSAASSTAIFLGAFAIVAMFVLKTVIKEYLNESDLGILATGLKNVANNIITVTKAPVVLIIFGVLGKLSDRILAFVPSINSEE